ncbi:hypothetical protein SLA2020_028050 [Shorea laevis]
MGFLFQNMLRALGFFWVFVSKFTVCVFGAIIRFMFRFQIDGDCKGNEIGPPPRFNGFKEKQRMEHDESEKREPENGLVAASRKYEFLYTLDIRGFVEEPKTESFTLHEFFVGSRDPTESAEIHLPKPESGTGDGSEEKIGDPVDSFVPGKSWEKQESDASGVFEGKAEYPVEGDAVDSVESFIEKQEMEANIHVDEKEEDSIEVSIIEKRLEKQQPRIEAADDTEGDRLEASLQSLEKQEQDEKEESDALEVKTGDSVQTSSIEMNSDNQENFYLHETNVNAEPDSSRMIDCNLEFGDSAKVENTEEIHSYSSVSEQKAELKYSCVGQEHASNESVVCSEKLFESISDSDEEDDDMEYEELKMQLRMARTGGLPTISEESEFSKTVEELHPLKIDDKLDRKDHVVEIQKVYKRYSDKMRKLDILNSQTKHAISLLQLSDLVHLNATGKSSAAPIKSVRRKNIWPFKQRTPEIDRAVKLIRDLEIVYVGQMCLSWEILRWQHGKVQHLLQYDPQGSFRYNHVAGEYQLFQVLVHRYLENEPFQGTPRVENYAKNRCLIPNFLQVPVIKDDRAESRKGVGQVELDEHATSSALLIEIVEESMQVFWEFLRADKDETNLSLKAPPQQRQVAPQDPLDLGILTNVRTNLQKKERRLKEIMRSTNCMVKRLQKNQRTAMDHALFIVQVELKLISRVLNMSKLTTDHLVWCHEKLEKINFSSRKLEIKPSMLLFPC